MDGSDSDDSAFLFTANLPKRKAGFGVRNKTKKLKFQDCDQLIDGIEVKEEEGSGNFLSDSVPIESSDVNEKLSESNLETLSTCDMPSVENSLKKEEGLVLVIQKQEDYFSCPLCLKVLHTETSHFSHMKQCAKKSKMTAKQLLEALQSHKKHLKERISAGLLNTPTKKKKIQEGRGDSAYELAIGLALSKSLEDGVVRKGYENLRSSDNADRRNSTTLEQFGFTTFGKPSIGAGKKSKNLKSIHSVLKKRTREEREKLLTEKASVVLLINDDTKTAETKDTLRVFHCKELEKARNKDSRLWKLCENIEQTEWYVEDLKNIIVEEDAKNTEKIEHQDVIYEQCNIHEEILKLNLPKATIFEDWKKLINNKNLSDLTLQTKDNVTIYLHSVVLYARCKKLLDSDLKNIFYKFDSSIVLKFLQYLYCGSLHGLLRKEIDNLINLAQLLNYQELLEILNTLRESLSEPVSKSNDGIASDCTQLRVNHLPEWQKNASSIPESNNCCEWECKNPKKADKRSSSLSEREKHLPDNEFDATSVTVSSHERKEESELKELSIEAEKLQYESFKKSVDECLFVREVIANDNNDTQLEACNKYTTKEEQSEMDMFEEEEMLNNSTNENIALIPDRIEKGDYDCIEISSGSLKSSGTYAEDGENVRENGKVQLEMDYEIPCFDPYEHFNNEILDTEPFTGSEEQIHNQSLVIGGISPLKSATPNLINNASPVVTPPGCCSTPNNEIHQPPTSACPDSTPNGLYGRKKKKYVTPCSKIIRSGRFSKLSRSRSQKKRKSRNGLDEESEKLACVLTESILRELDNSIGSGVKKSQPTEECSYIEVTPTVPNQEFAEEVSPLPDFSIMGASTVKKNLAKYGIKKSLCKSKARKILEHIYEELHPVINMRNRKIMKHIRSDKSKKSKGKKVGKGKRDSTGKIRSTPMRRGKRETDVRRSRRETPAKKKIGCSTVPRLSSPTMTLEEDVQSCMITESYDGASTFNTLSDGNSFEVEESLTQTNYTNAIDAPTAIYDYIHDNPDFRRKILMYEPIWLEELRKNLFQKYNKKFKLTDLMNCLDAECITFRCESQKRTNNRRRQHGAHELPSAQRSDCV